MQKFSGHHDHWTEFQWEREIRRDERRISEYFRELSLCLDLPGEEELIFEQLSSRSDLVPTPGASEALRSWQCSHDDDDDDDGRDFPRRAPGSTVVDELDLLTTEWNLLCASKLRVDLSLEGLGISCAFAKLLARTADFTEPERECENTLLISLGKRSLADLNDLQNQLAELEKSQHSLTVEIEFFTSRLAQIREALLSHLVQLRSIKEQ